MSEEYKVQISTKNSRGDLLNVRGATAQEVDGIVEEASKLPAFAGFFSQTTTVVAVETGSGAEVDTDTAQAMVTKHLGADQVEPASAAQVTYLVKLGVSEAEAKGLSKTDASARITALKGSK